MATRVRRVLFGLTLCVVQSVGFDKHTRMCVHSVCGSFTALESSLLHLFVPASPLCLSLPILKLGFLLLCCEEGFCIYSIRPLLHVAYRCFLLFVGYLFILLNTQEFFDTQMSFIFMKSSVPAKNFLDLAVNSRPLVHLGLIFRYEEGSSFIILHVDTQSFQHHLLKRLFFPS